MRRLGLFAALLSLVGLSTAFAASFDVQTEDLTTFSTATSISVPPPPAAPRTFYLRGGDLPAMLADTPEGAGGPVQGKSIVLDPASVQQQSQSTKYHTWRTDAAPSSGILVAGRVRLYIDQNGKNNPQNQPNDRLTAALFDCPSSAPAESTSCTLIAGPARNSGLEGNGFAERVVDFGYVNKTVLAGRQLRLKIVNRTVDDSVPPKTISNADWQIQWGYKENRPARIEVTAS